MTVPLAVPAALGPLGQPSATTVATPRCNDCTVAQVERIVARARGAARTPAAWRSYRLRDELLELNIIGLRREDSLSNRFDDEIIVLYRPIDLDAADAVADAAFIGRKLAVAEIEAFLGDDEVQSQLDIDAAAPKLPGDDSMSEGEGRVSRSTGTGASSASR